MIPEPISSILAGLTYKRTHYHHNFIVLVLRCEIGNARHAILQNGQIGGILGRGLEKFVVNLASSLRATLSCLRTCNWEYKKEKPLQALLQVHLC